MIGQALELTVFESCAVDSTASTRSADSHNRLINQGQLHLCLSLELATEQPRDDLHRK